jgi:hypothetical protein
MGHDITGFTRNGDRIEGPSFGIFNLDRYSLYCCLDAEHHNAGVSGDGGTEEMTPARLQRAFDIIDAAIQNDPGDAESLGPVREFLQKCLEAEVVKIKFW